MTKCCQVPCGRCANGTQWAFDPLTVSLTCANFVGAFDASNALSNWWVVGNATGDPRPAEHSHDYKTLGRLEAAPRLDVSSDKAKARTPTKRKDPRLLAPGVFVLSLISDTGD